MNVGPGSAIADGAAQDRYMRVARNGATGVATAVDADTLFTGGDVLADLSVVNIDPSIAFHTFVFSSDVIAAAKNLPLAVGLRNVGEGTRIDTRGDSIRHIGSVVADVDPRAGSNPSLVAAAKNTAPDALSLRCRLDMHHIH